MQCLLCGQETTGSIGAAGIRWPNLCQPCKDQEDAALERRLDEQGDYFARRAIEIDVRDGRRTFPPNMYQ